MKNTLLRSLSIFIVVGSILYLMAWFGTLHFDFRMWSSETRAFMIVVGVIATAFISALTEK